MHRNTILAGFALCPIYAIYFRHLTCIVNLLWISISTGLANLHKEEDSWHQTGQSDVLCTRQGGLMCSAPDRVV